MIPSDSAQRLGWLADVDEDQEGAFVWRAVLQLVGIQVVTDGPWFDTEDACLEFIETEIVGKGLW